MITALLLLALSTPAPLPAGALCTPTSVGYAGPRYPAGIAICRRRVTTTMRRTVFASYGIPWAHRRLYELDHLVPLCLGGSNELSNLAPVSWPSAKRKDVIEKRLCSKLRAGRVTQAAAVEEMLRWR